MLASHVSQCVATFGRPADVAYEMKLLGSPTGVKEYRWKDVPFASLPKATAGVPLDRWQFKLSADRRTAVFSLRSHPEMAGLRYPSL